MEKNICFAHVGLSQKKTNDIKKWDDYDKAPHLLEEINAAKKKTLFDTTLKAKIVNSMKNFEKRNETCQRTCIWNIQIYKHIKAKKWQNRV